MQQGREQRLAERSFADELARAERDEIHVCTAAEEVRDGRDGSRAAVRELLEHAHEVRSAGRRQWFSREVRDQPIERPRPRAAGLRSAAQRASDGDSAIRRRIPSLAASERRRSTARRRGARAAESPRRAGKVRRERRVQRSAPIPIVAMRIGAFRNGVGRTP